MTIFDLRGSALSKLIMRQTVSKDEAGSGLFEKPVLEKVYLTHPLTNKRANTKSNGKVNAVTTGRTCSLLSCGRATPLLRATSG